MRVMMKDTIAVIVDYQEKLVPVMNEATAVIKNTMILLEGLKILEVPMLVTQQYTKGLGNTIERIQNILEFVPIEKISFSAYDEIQEQIKGKKFVIVCGIEAHICVLQTVIDLVEAGYQPVLVADCISSRKELDKQYAIKRAEEEGAIITTYEAILFELLQKAGSEKSKQIQKLIKL
ncbi:MAG: isochorismatase family protein [Eubacteriales bacterium]